MTLLLRHWPARAAAVAVLAAALPAAVVPAAAETRTALPLGVTPLADGGDCPSRSLCLYRERGQLGPAYAITAGDESGHEIDLADLPMGGGNGSAADNVSSWVNRSAGIVLLIDDYGQQRPLFPRQVLEEPRGLDNSVDRVRWLT